MVDRKIDPFERFFKETKKTKKKNKKNSCCTVLLEHILKKMCLCSLFDYSVIAWFFFFNVVPFNNQKRKK